MSRMGVLSPKWSNKRLLRRTGSRVHVIGLTFSDSKNETKQFSFNVVTVRSRGLTSPTAANRACIASGRSASHRAVSSSITFAPAAAPIRSSRP